MIAGAEAAPCISGIKEGVIVEKQKVSLLRHRSNKKLTVLGIAACLLLSPAAGMALFLPQVLTVIPVLLLALLGYAGPVAAAACTGVLVAMSAAYYGIWGGVSVFVLLVPTVLTAAVALEREQPFWQAVAAGGVAMFASMGAVVAMLSVLAGSDVVSALMDVMRQMFASSSMFGDTLLSMLMQMGVITAPEGVELGASFALTPEIREELSRTLVLTMDSVLRLELPMQMATGSVAAGLLGRAVLRKGLIARGAQVEYPRLHTWRVPKGWGRILGGTLLILYLLAALVPKSMNTMFYVFSGVFDRVFALQGIAAVCYLLEEKKKPAIFKKIVFIAGYFFLGSIAMTVGIFDQAMDFAHRREKLDELENPFDPRHGAQGNS